MKNKVDNWIKSVKKLSEITLSEPHAAYATFTQCLQGQWTFLCRSMPSSAELFEPLEETIRFDFIRALLKRDVNNLERELLSLPVRMGGMGISKPTEECVISHFNSVYVSLPLVRLIEKQISEFDPHELAEKIKELRSDVDGRAEARHKDKRDTLLAQAPEKMKIAIKAASEKGGSSWMTAIPSYDHGTVLHKGDFVDSCYIRYGWELLNLPTSCACGATFDVQHALDCQLGGLRTIQHNEVRDVMAQFMREAGHTTVEVEPKLQELSGEVFDYLSANKESEARSDIKCCGFWSNMRQAYFDVKVVSPFARSYCNLKPAQLFKQAERAKIREYRERILNVEHGDFTPLVFTCSGGMAPQSHFVLKLLAERLSKKQNISESVVSGWLRARLSFALLRTTLLCVRATRRKKVFCDNNIELAVSATRMDY